jgi:hypothetical protein
MIANERKYLFHILKIYSLKIHVGLNQKFTAENSCSKNLHLKIHGLKIHGRGFGCSPLGRGRVHCFNACKGKYNKRQQQ